MRFDTQYRVWYYSKLGVPGLDGLTRDQVARSCGYVTPAALKNLATYLNNHGIEDLRDLVKAEPKAMLADHGIGVRTMYTAARLINGLHAHRLTGKGEAWLIENDAPVSPEEEVDRVERQLGKPAPRLTRGRQSERFVGSVRATPKSGRSPARRVAGRKR